MARSLDTTQWTVLPPLSIVDGHSAQTESFDSYTARMAAIFSLPNKAFFRWIDELASGAPLPRAKFRAPINGPSERSNQRVGVMEKLTLLPLRLTTLWSLSDVLSKRHHSGFATRYRRWCHRCLRDGEAIGLSDRLIWNFQHYSRCAIHQTPIQDRCSRCGVRQPYGRPLSGRFNCIWCSSSLAEHGRLTMDAHEWTNHALEELVSWCSSEDAFVVPRENFDVYISCVHDLPQVAELRARDPRRFQNIFGTRPRSLSVGALLNASSIQGVTPLDVLLSPRQAASAPLLDLASDSVVIPWPIRTLTEKVEQIRSMAVSLLNCGCRTLPSMAWLETITGASNGLLRRAYPDLHRAYISKSRLSSETSLPGLVPWTQAFDAALGRATAAVTRNENIQDSAAWLARIHEIPQSTSLEICRGAHAVALVLKKDLRGERNFGGPQAHGKGRSFFET